MINEKYRNIIFRSGIVEDASDMIGTIIEGASFAREYPTYNMFPQDMRGVTFSYCDLDNIVMPEGNTLINCSNIFYKVQEDGLDWIIDLETGTPIKVLGE